MATIPVPMRLSKSTANSEQALSLSEMLGYSNEYLLRLMGRTSTRAGDDSAEEDCEYFTDGAGI